MRKFLLLVLISLFTFSVQAQYVTIPDPGFVSWLTFNYPNCMNGNQMDTTCADILSPSTAGYVTISGYTIHDLEGIQYFDAMSTLICSNNSLDSIPYLPQNLIRLTVPNNDLATLPNLPASLTSLDIRQNNLTSLPALPPNLDLYYGGSNPNLPLPVFPTTITELDISDNNLSSFPAFWSGIENLSIGGNPNASIPVLPSTVLYLTINDQGLTQLPPLPAGLIDLEAQFNDFTVLNNFPSSLELLRITNCPNLDSVYNLPASLTSLTIQQSGLTYLGNFPPGLTSAYLDYNNLTEIPTLPSGINTLTAEFNQLTSISPLPATMTRFRVGDNDITCFPVIPDVSGVPSLNIRNNPNTCVPNYTNDMTSVSLNKPLCDLNDTVNNPQGCSGAKGISGRIFQDDDSNCQWASNEAGIQNIPVRIFDAGMNQVGVTSSLRNGSYFFPVNIGTYNVMVDTTGKPIIPSCVNPGIDSTITMAVGDSLAEGISFGFECESGFDIGALNAHVDGWVFPGQMHELRLNLGDISGFYNLNCAQGVSGTVVVTVTGPVSYVNYLPGTMMPAVSANTFTYTIADFAAVDFFNDFGLEFETDTTAQSGNQVCVDVMVNPIAGDNDTSNNHFTYCYDVVNSYDPNNKLVYPKEVEPGFDDYLNYTINFQNTGSAPAFNIRLEDTLSADLDLETFQVTGYSHDYHYTIRGDRLQIFFPNIMLPDSNSNEPESKGFFSFKVKPNSQMNVGDTIYNRASIYFDFNAPIVTNTAKAYAPTPSSIEGLELENVRVYPSPFTNYFIVNGLNDEISAALFNALGEMIWQDEISQNESISTADFAPGFYFLHLSNEEGSRTVKLIKR